MGRKRRRRLVFVARGRFVDAFGYFGAELGRSDDFGVAAVAENQALKLVVDDNFERQLYAAVTESLLDFLRFVKRL